MKAYGDVKFQANANIKMDDSLSTLPGTAEVGDIIFNNANKKTYVAISTTPTWVELSNVTDIYVHTQSAASNSWTINHNLGTTDVIVELYDSSNNKFLADNVATTNSNTVTVTLSSSISGKAVVLTGDANGLASGSPSTIYDISGSTLSQPTNAAVLQRFVAVRSYNLPASLTGSYAVSSTSATGSPQYPIKKNGVSIGTINYTGTTGSFTFSSSVTFDAGDILTVEAPSTADATHNGLAWTFKGVLL